MKNGYETSNRESGFISHDALNQIVTLSKLKYNLKMTTSAAFKTTRDRRTFMCRKPQYLNLGYQV